MKNFSLAFGVGCVGILLVLALTALIAVPISLVVGALWNIIAPQFGFAPWDGVTAYAVTLLVMIVGSMIGKS